MHKLAKLSARERQQIIDDFVDGVFAGADQDGPAAGIARGMRRLPAELPDDPAPEQVSAWVELAELVADEDFRQRARSMALAGQQAAPDGAASGGEAQPDYRTFTDRISQAMAAGVAPGSTEGQALLDSIVPATAGRAQLLAQLETFTDARVERYWQLLAILNGQPAPPSVVPAFDWLIAALRANLS